MSRGGYGSRMETSGYSDRSDDEFTAPTAGGVSGEDEPVSTPDPPSAGDEPEGDGSDQG